MVILFSCKKKDVEPKFASELVITIKDTGKTIGAKDQCNVIVYKSQADFDSGKNAIAGEMCDANGVVSLKNLENAVFYIRVWNNETGETRANPVITPKLVPGQTTNVEADLPN